jgi:hypothetical protein
MKAKKESLKINFEKFCVSCANNKEKAFKIPKID